MTAQPGLREAASTLIDQKEPSSCGSNIRLYCSCLDGSAAWLTPSSFSLKLRRSNKFQGAPPNPVLHPGPEELLCCWPSNSLLFAFFVMACFFNSIFHFIQSFKIEPVFSYRDLPHISLTIFQLKGRPQ